jgi:hypothetical protein
MKQISPNQLILSHSPMRELALKYEDSNVLVVGGNGSDCRNVAEHYGFKHVVTPEEVHAVYPSVCPSSVCEARSIPLAEVIGLFLTRMLEWKLFFNSTFFFGSYGVATARSLLRSCKWISLSLTHSYIIFLIVHPHSRIEVFTKCASASGSRHGLSRLCRLGSRPPSHYWCPDLSR